MRFLRLLGMFYHDLFTDTAAILNLLDLRSIMGCPGDTRSVLMRSFRAKRERNCLFLGKKAIIITLKQGTTFFFPLQSFFRKTSRKIGSKSARTYTERVFRNVLIPPGHPIILFKSNKFNVAAVSVKWSCPYQGYPTRIYFKTT